MGSVTRKWRLSRDQKMKKEPNKRPEPMAVLRTAIGSSLNDRRKMFALKIGVFGRTEMPAIEDQDGPGVCVDLNWWIALTQRSERLEEVPHPDDRPTTLFRRADGSKFEAGKRGQVEYIAVDLG